MWGEILFFANNISVMDKIDHQLQQFWEIEEPFITRKIKWTPEELKCEKYFTDTISRSKNDGRYTVSMPLIEEPTVLGTSREIALKKFQEVEKRIIVQPELHLQYNVFMKEYEQLKHMTLVLNDTQTTPSTSPPISEYYLPHHPVIKESSTTTKLRVVFNTSSKTSTGKSLNDTLMVGPIIQDNLFSVLIRFRLHEYVKTADIEKMYRKILIQPDQRDLLKILWRDNPKEELKTYRLNTITYGTASAPY